MKKTINSIQDALALSLERLFYTERKIMEDFTYCIPQIKNEKLKTEISRYIDSAENKLLKLERIFGYLMQEPAIRRNEIIVKLLEETHQQLSQTDTDAIKDMLMISCIQNINAYKTSSYRTSYLLAAELELDTATDLLQQILEWEVETGKALSTLSIEVFNKVQQATRQN